MIQGQPSFIHGELSATVLASHHAEGLPEDLSEFPNSAVVPAELLLDGCPRDKLRSAWIDAVEPLGEPGVDVERHGRLRQGSYGALIKRNSMLLQAVEVIETKTHS